MQKKLKSLLAIASLTAAVVVFFVACGEGDRIVLDQSKIELYDTAKDILELNIADGTIYEGEEPQPTPSSPGGGVSSSSNPGTQSSAEGTPDPNGCNSQAKPTGFSCNWNNLKPLPGTSISAKNSSCNITQWYYKDSQGSFAECMKFAGGLSAREGKSYYLFAKVSCSGTEASVDCGSTAVTATAPSLSGTGTCKWDSNPTAAATGATASGVTLNDPSGICGSNKVKYYEGTNEWQQGKAVSIGKHNVHATVDCPDYPNIGKVDCPELEVKDVMYQIKGQNNENAITIDGPAPINVAIKMSLPANWHNETNGTCTFYCDVTRGSNGDGKLEGTVDGIELSGGDHVTATIKITSTINDYSLPLKITKLGGSSIKCGINW